MADHIFNAITFSVDVIVMGCDGVGVAFGISADSGVDADMAGVNALTGKVSVQRMRPVAQTRHGDADVAHHGCGIDGRAAGGKEQGAVAAGQHIGQYLLDGGDGAMDVKLDLNLHVLVRYRGRRSHGQGGGSRRVLQYVDRAVAFLDTGERSDQRWLVKHIGWEAGGVDTKFGELGNQAVELVLSACDEGDPEAIASKELGECLIR